MIGRNKDSTLGVESFLKKEDTHMKKMVTLIPGHTIKMYKYGSGSPVVLISAGIHACEYIGMNVVEQLAKELENTPIHGTLRLIPIMNIEGFYQRSVAINPVDGKNLNRCFNLDEPSSYSEQLIRAFEEDYISKADIYLDLHSADLQEALYPHLYFNRLASPDTVKKAKELARYIHCDFALGSSSAHSSHAGGMKYHVPSLLIERGGQGQINKGDIALMKKDVLNLLKGIGMLEGEATINTKQNQILKCEEILSKNNGKVTCYVKAGDKVHTGDRLIDVETIDEQVETYFAKEDGTILYITTSYGCFKGQVLIAFTVQ